MENIDDKYKKKSPFTVPEGYFDKLTDRIADRVQEEKKPQKVRFIQIVKPYMGLAAIFMLAFLVVQVVFPHFIDPNKMILKEGETVEQTQQAVATDNEIIFDSYFNPTNEEIIEYLTTEIDSYDLIYAGIY